MLLASWSIGFGVGQKDKSQRVLVIDDETPLADTLVMVLKSRGYEPRAAHTADEAAQIIDTGWQPDAVLFDSVLLGEDGIDVALSIRERNPGCKFVLMSGHAESYLTEIAKRFAFPLRVLRKPFLPAQMIAALQT